MALAQILDASAAEVERAQAEMHRVAEESRRVREELQVAHFALISLRFSYPHAVLKVALREKEMAEEHARQEITATKAALKESRAAQSDVEATLRDDTTAKEHERLTAGIAEAVRWCFVPLKHLHVLS